MKSNLEEDIDNGEVMSKIIADRRFDMCHINVLLTCILSNLV